MKQNLSDLSVSVGDMQVSLSSKVRDLGVVFDQYFTFHDHISGICRYTHFHFHGIGRIRNLLTFDATAQLIHALITSRLDFCNSILYNLPNKQIERLQRIQNQAAHMLKRIPRRKYITPVLRELHWLRIHNRFIFKIDSYCIYIICIIFMFLQCVSTVIIVYIIISSLNSYLYIHWILDFK